jgi:3-dehydroquinate synthetase
MVVNPISIDIAVGDRQTVYRLGDGALAGLTAALAGRPAAALIDAPVASLHGHRLRTALADPALPVYVVPGGEAVKTLAGLEAAIGWLAAAGVTRDAVLIGVGGGAVLDLAGLAASLWQRGIAYVALPSTLLAMVDAAIGGKTAVNAAGLKNPIGTFHPAEIVLAEPALLSTLARARWREGLSELIKAAVIGDPTLFAALEERRGTLARLAGGDRDATDATLPAALPWSDWIGRAVAVKAALVARDFCDRGPRQALNLGHTLGHVLEAHTAATGDRLHHGEAVAVGMAAAARIAVARGGCPAGDGERLIALLTACGLPTAWPLPPRAELERLLAGDKKRRPDRGGWVLPERIGRVRIGQTVAWDDLTAAVAPAG